MVGEANIFLSDWLPLEVYPNILIMCSSVIQGECMFMLIMVNIFSIKEK